MLDAPELQDDFYLNLVDWSSQNVLSVGLGTCVYLWSACTSQVNIEYFLLPCRLTSQAAVVSYSKTKSLVFLERYIKKNSLPPNANYNI